MCLELTGVLFRVSPWIMVILFGFLLQSLHHNLGLLSFFVDEFSLELRRVREFKLT